MNKIIRDNKYILLGLIILIAIAHQLVFVNTPYDDSYISYRYAKNWADGLGLVFNEGEMV